MNKTTCLLLMIFLVGCKQRAVESPTKEAPRIALDAESVWTEHLPTRPSNGGERLLIRSMDGQVVVSDDGHTWRDAQLGEKLQVGWLVRSGVNGKVKLEFEKTGMMLWVDPNTRLKLVRTDVENTGIEVVPDTMIDLEVGRIEGNPRKISAAGSLMVRTSAGVVTGAEWSSISADGTVR